MADPTVTAVILALDEEAYIGEAIESVLGQTRACEQVVVVDNGSTDRTLEIVRGYAPRVELVHEPRRGIGLARNAGLRAASGDYLAFLDGDDTWEAEKTERQLEAFEREEGLELVFGHARQVLSPDLDPAIASRLRLPGGPQPGLHLGAMLATRDAWDRVGPWEESWEASDGLDWLLRARGLGLREAMLPDVVLTRRIHGANHSLGNRDKRDEWARLLKASLDRRRAEGERPG